MLDKTCDFSAIEHKHYKAWEDSGAFAAPSHAEGEPYCIMMPPPNVTGSLHMGHALTFTLQDVLIRFNRMSGRDTLWQPGTDHAGIATQMVVERQLDEQNIHRRDLGREKFVKRVWEWKEQSGGTITRQLRRLGTSPDWARERFTMDEGLSKAVRKVFVQLHEEGLIYRDKRLVNWDPKLHTAISDLEVEQRDVDGHLWHLRYPLADDPEKHVVVATTRPETMMGDTAVAVHPEDERYKDMIGKEVQLPLSGRRIPIVADEHADPDVGSGAVKITPAHDFNDFEVGKRHDLPMINVLDRDAKLNDNVPEIYRGLDRYVARRRIVEDLQAQGLVEKIEPHRHVQPHGDRSNVVIEPWLTDQWYCDAETLAKPAIEAVETGKTKFVPKQWENTYFEWMRNIQPWCISRQLWWGHQIPAWYGPDGEIFVAHDQAEAQAMADAHYGKSTEITQDEDVLDTWFSSALWPFSTLGWPDQTDELKSYYPGNVLVTGFDIIFFWVARMMMMGLHFMKEVPFHEVYIHALVRDEKGQKMSKSKGNIIDPLVVADEYGADALRFTLTAMAAQGRDIKLATSRVEGYRNFATKIWNAARFCEMNECVLDAGFDPKSVKNPINRWIIGKLATSSQDVSTAIKAYRFNDAADAAYHFTWGSFCDWYLEFIKPALYEGDTETRQTAAWVLDKLLYVLHPIMPYITEELYQHMGEDRGLLINQKRPDLSGLEDAQAADQMDWVIRLITTIRGVRSEMKVPPSAQLSLHIHGANDETKARAERYSDIISRMARISSISFEPADSHGALQAVLDEAVLFLPLADVIDLDAERARLAKEVGAAKTEIEKLEKKLNNTQFLEKAPAEVIEEQRSRKEQAEQTLAKLGEALNRLGGSV